MNKYQRVIIGAAAFLIVTTGAVRRSVADEAANNNYSWANGANNQWNGNMTVLSAYALSATWPGIETISPSGDADYLLMTCGTAHIYGAGIDLIHANGDLDLVYYSTNGTYLGGSASTTNAEWLGLGNQYNSVVVKVYGYAGATNSYTPRLSCM